MTATLDDIHNDLRVRTTTGEILNLATVIAMIAGLAPWSEPLVVDYEVDNLDVSGNASVDGVLSIGGASVPHTVSMTAAQYRHMQWLVDGVEKGYLGYLGLNYADVAAELCDCAVLEGMSGVALMLNWSDKALLINQSGTQLRIGGVLKTLSVDENGYVKAS